MTDPRQRMPSQSAAGFAAAERERVLARRRMALIIFVALVPITLVLAIITGSMMLLMVNLIADVLVAGYVALLLQIKQGQSGGPPVVSRGGGDIDDVRVVRR